MTFSDAGSILATLTQANRMGALARRVKDLPVTEFVCLLDFITAEFQQFLRAIELINNEALETMLEQLLDAFTLKIGQILQADRTTIFLVDNEKKQLWSKLTPIQNGKPIEIRIPLHVGIVGHVATTGTSLNIADVYSHPLFNKEVDEHPGYTTHSLLCMPIFSSKNPNQVVAVVQLLNKAGTLPFTKEDEEEFSTFATSIGIILESCQSFYVAARNQRGVSALLKATSSLGQSLDLEATLRSVMDQARELMQAERSTLFLLSKETGELWTKVAKADGKTMMEIRIPANKGIAGYVASTRQTLNIPDAYQDPRFDPTTDKRTGYVTRTILCMPVYNSAGDLIGVTQLINKYQGSFTSSDEAFMRAFNAQAGIALENAQLFENVLIEKQYQKDILQSLSDAVISTDMQGRIVTINEAALALLGCPENSKHRQLWENKLIDRYVWEVVPIETLRWRLLDSLNTGARHYIPEQDLTVGLYVDPPDAQPSDENAVWILAIPERTSSSCVYIPWNKPVFDVSAPIPAHLPKERIIEIQRSINLTVNPLTNPEGGVRGGLVVIEDISREKRMKSTMYRYLTPGVAERVMALGEDSLVVSERKEVTILFSDIRGYTTLTENLGASEVVSLLNEYFETMVEAVFNHEGTLDKFIGDALMAVFGAPLPLTENHAWMAVQSALDMRRRLQEFNNKRIISAQPRIQIGIGLSSGEVVSGNIGSKKRMDYTVIGDAVNLSSRLESVTKEYNCDIILSEFTYQLCGERIWARELDKIRVKGKHQAVSIYELIAERSVNLDADTREFLELYKAGRAAYMQRDFQKAIAYFESAAKIRKDDRAVAIHLERCRNYLKNPPPDFWDGVYTFTTK
ncbi:MAG: GAF domain-containing protein [Oscillatoriaceae bacterium SKW80]|nr:GAF domain-containing protein [Oscillatoriaceae bacterium SKYG93]MCX8120545.1 GAF domain-containing protein [Oscillatoriaceae bacterium SKW80]MDW8452783.1 GAF domain-containing protein [Oscillatoriaceae cyanobacterium SKYGB_i_bin93]HIK27147.1 GAF domain-containing protein [Oscillatoriaceae cyanobacterium M7585_C2015_266]